MFKKFLEVFFLLCIICYIGYHIFNGEYGIMSYTSIKKELFHKQIEYQNSLNETTKIQNKINGLKIDNLDLDLFEEEFKKNTGFISKNEIVIFIDKNNNK